MTLNRKLIQYCYYSFTYSPEEMINSQCSFLMVRDVSDILEDLFSFDSCCQEFMR